ncbi:MAG TPA: substrate-binding domain-containing protein [Phycisphaerae bacterium]|nr:substrate-binding domain-containing protein [Phycisphaerae bacterium]
MEGAGEGRRPQGPDRRLRELHQSGRGRHRPGPAGQPGPRAVRSRSGPGRHQRGDHGFGRRCRALQGLRQLCGHRQLRGRAEGGSASGRAPRRQRPGAGDALPGGLGQHHGTRTRFPRHHGQRVSRNPDRFQRSVRRGHHRDCLCQGGEPLNRFSELEGIFTPNESTTFGMLRALEGSNRAGKVRFVGFDSSEKLVQALAAGRIHGLVLQDPLNMGYMAVKTLVAYLRGEEVPARIDTGSEVATPENMNEPRIQELLKPPIEKYLGN